MHSRQVFSNRTLSVTGLAVSLLLAAPLASAEEAAAPAAQAGTELPVRLIPNVPKNAEAYYGPDSFHIIAQTQDPQALKAKGRDSGALTYIFTDQGTDVHRINDKGQDACSYFFPDGKRIVWTSTKDH
ncbi:MAG: hypothetical protein WAU48_08050, partial [Gammaproteobacteria bacterium]